MKTKRIFAVLLSFVMILSFFPYAFATENSPEELPEGLSSLEAGDIVTFGRYEQDNDTGNGPEPIDWIVLDIKDGDALLLSMYVIDVRTYHHSIKYVTWEECSLRSWLNNDFCHSAFSDAEQADIVETTLDNPENPHFHTNGCRETEDRIFLLSIEEADRYFPYDADRATSYTAYAAAQGDSLDRWWLRSPGSFRTYAACVRGDGVILHGGEISTMPGVGVRPALRLRGGSAEATLISAKRTKDISADAYIPAAAGEFVHLDGTEGSLELQLFTSSFDNQVLMSASTRYPAPAQGELYLLRFAISEDGTAMDYDSIKKEIAPLMQLYAPSNGDTSKVFEIITPDDRETRVFDLLFYCENYHELSDMELLCDGVLYPLDTLPRNGEKLALPTAEELAIASLNALHERAKSENGLPINEADCSGNVIVAYYTSSDGNATPKVLTANSDDDWDFPREYRAENFEKARWAAIIHPTYKQVGWYGGVAPGAANQTTTWLSLFDLETEKLYEVKVATEDPPQTITVQTINGIPQRSGASGTFRGEDAMARLAELVETASIQSVG